MKNKVSVRINEKITAKEVRVIGSDNRQIGVLPTREAIYRAREEGLDLIEIAPMANPPVAKIIELGKYKYELNKRLKKEKKGVKASEVKEVRFSPFIGKADYDTKMSRVRTFLSQGHKIRVVVKFKGREMNSKKFGYELIDNMVSSLKDKINVDMQPKFLGRHLTMVISPLINQKKRKKQKMPKQKTKKSITRRFRVTKNGKVLRLQGFRRHLNTKKSSKRKRALKRTVSTNKVHSRKIRKYLNK